MRRSGGENPVVTPEAVGNDFGIFTAAQHDEAEAARFQDDMLTYYVVCSPLVPSLPLPFPFHLRCELRTVMLMKSPAGEDGIRG